MANQRFSASLLAPLAAFAALAACGSGTARPADPSDPADAASPGPTPSPSPGPTPPPAPSPTPTPPPAPSASACLGSDFLASLGKSTVLTGAQMSDATAAETPFDIRYLYIAGPISDGTGPCSSCGSSCTSEGLSCSNSAGCGWWGCWQWDQQPPGQYIRDFVAKARQNEQVPMISYYTLLQSSRVQEGAPQVTVAARDAAFMKRYLADYRFVLQQIGSAVALVHVEPDFWGYAQQLSSDPHSLPAAVASANPTDCADQENSIAGLGRCFIAMARKYAPNAKVGLHASGWGRNFDVTLNTDPSYDVAANGRATGEFFKALGAGAGDFVALYASDRDAGYYQRQDRITWWDATNAKLPNFHQALAWGKAVAEAVGKPVLWWNLPVGNTSLDDSPMHYRDNRVDYFLTHMQELADSHAVAAIFGPGASDQTNAESDGGNLEAKARAYAASRTAFCQ